MKPSNYLDAMRQHQGRLIDKWSHYPEIYERHLARFRDQAVRVLEVGVSHGGSLQLLRNYLGPKSEIVGMDINPLCAAFNEPGITVEIGDQGNPADLGRILARYGPFDIIIDDGSHISGHQALTHHLAWPHLKYGGVFMVEDTHCCYRNDFGGGLRHPQSFVEQSKLLIDDLHGIWQSDPPLSQMPRYTPDLGSIHFYDSIIVFEKVLKTANPVRIDAGQPSWPVSNETLAGIAEARANLAKLVDNQ